MLAMGWRNSARHWQRYEIGLSAARRPGDAAGRLGPLGRQLRLRHLHRARLARDGLPAVLRRRGHLLRLRDGARAVRFRCGISTACKTSSRIDHLDVMGKILLATSLLTSYGYFSEQFMAWYGGEAAESYVYLNRLIGFGQYAVDHLDHRSSATSSSPQILWFRPLRRNQAVLFIVSLLVLVGMWLERYMIICTSLQPRFSAVVVGHVPADDLGLS